MEVNKKHLQLGMNPSTASGRLVKDLLFSFIVKTGNNTCYRCGECMSRDDFSVEHKVAWLDSYDPLKLYFDLDNISFSHLRCNIKASRVPNKIVRNAYEIEELRQTKMKRSKDWRDKNYTPESRKERYRRTGN